jgi:hypothetical protein
MLENLWSMRESQPSFAADILLNPREQSYDVDELVALLAEAGLRFVEWLHPGAWKLSSYVDDPSLVSLVQGLGSVDEAQIVQRIVGLTSPKLEVLVERDDAPERPPYDLEERLAMPMIASPGARELDLSGGALRSERAIPAFTTENGLVGGVSRAASASERAWAMPEASLPVLRAFDGTRTVAELAREFAEKGTSDALLAAVEVLGPRDVGLLAPAWALTR